MMFARRTVGENPAILRRREQDAKAMTIRATEKEEFRKTYISDWQAKGVAKMEEIQIQNIARQLEEQQAQQLEQRRQLLAEMLNMEEEQYREELLAKQPNTLDRLQHTLAVARQFRAEKEARRKQYVQEQYMRLWRENCDDIRTMDSETYLKYTKEEQHRQMAEKRELTPEQKAEEAYWLQLWKEDMAKKEARDKADQERRYLLAKESRDAAFDQINERERLRELEQEQKRIERLEWSERIKQEQLEQQRAREEASRAKRLNAKRISEINEEMQRKKLEEKRRQEREDKEMIDLMTAEYEAELARKRQDRLTMQREMAAYRQYLIERKAEERRLEEDLDRITQEYQDLTNQKQDAEWAANDARRQKLMKEVHAIREQQIALKKAEMERTKNRELHDRQLMDLQVLLQQQAEEQEELDRFNRELESKLDLELQIRQKSNEKQAEKLRLQQEHEAALMAEAQYREFVRLEQGRSRLVQHATMRK